jgi:hypothetical protein
VDGPLLHGLQRRYLEFYTLSNGGAFMAPEVENDELWSLFNTMNGNGGDMSAEAAGIAVCLMAYSHHACRTECDAMTEHYYRCGTSRSTTRNATPSCTSSTEVSRYGATVTVVCP